MIVYDFKDGTGDLCIVRGKEPNAQMCWLTEPLKLWHSTLDTTGDRRISIDAFFKRWTHTTYPATDLFCLLHGVDI